MHVAPTNETRVVHGMRVSTPVRLFAELAGDLSLVDLVVLGDQLVRRGLTSPAELRRRAQRERGERGRLARRAAALVRAGVDSPMETRVRLLILLAGIPEPLVNHPVRDERGDVIRRFDLYWPEAGLVVEYDGRVHIEREQQWVRDLRRREGDENAGLRVLVFVSSDVFRTPGETVRRVFEVLRSRGCPGLPSRPRDEWRTYFGV